MLHNWRREAEKFTPEMKVLVLESGAARHNLRKQIPQHDIIVTNYALLRRDLEEFHKFSFPRGDFGRGAVHQESRRAGHAVGQAIEMRAQNRAHRHAAGKSAARSCGASWTSSSPATSATRNNFWKPTSRAARTPSPSSASPAGGFPAKLRPLLLRRLKKHVAKDLPERIEERRDCPLGEEQRKLYLAELRRSRDQVMKAVETQGLNKSKMHVLAALTRLRQICCHPALVGSNTASGKTDTLFELLDPFVADGQKVLVFSQFVQMLQLLEKECAARNIHTHILTGQTKDRQSVVTDFQKETGACVFLLSLRAAGTGLNLTNASYVVLYDPWWNPAVEAQAIDRSHRIGQTQTVNAYRLIAPGTVEEKIWELQQSKAKPSPTCWAKKVLPAASPRWIWNTFSRRNKPCQPPRRPQKCAQSVGSQPRGRAAHQQPQQTAGHHAQTNVQRLVRPHRLLARLGAVGDLRV